MSEAQRISEQADESINGGSIKGHILDEINYQVNKDRYVGEVDPTTKLRNGQGCYTYVNPYFQYQGTWVNGVKD